MSSGTDISCLSGLTAAVSGGIRCLRLSAYGRCANGALPRYHLQLTLVLFAVVSVSARVQIKLNQLGFYPQTAKIAIAVGATSDSFQVVDQASGAPVYSGILGAAQRWSASDEEARIADFSELETPGTYVVTAAGCDESYPFSIDCRVHLEVARGAIKGFYYNRCSYELAESFAGMYARKMGHPDTAVQIHPSAESTNRPAKTKIASPGGWYDAGDYGKYIVNSGISTYTLFAAYEAFSAFFDTLNVALPESGNGIPDLLDEALFNLRWMLTMQDPDDGGVYHKLTTAEFSGMVMPEHDRTVRYLVAKSTAAALDFAAVCAHASRLFGKFETKLPGFSDRCLNASLRAWQWARENPEVFFHNADCTGPDIYTGEYGDGNPADEFLWAATELFIATQQDSFFTVAFPEGNLSGVNKVPSWPNVGTLGLYSLFLCGKEFSTVSSDRIKSAVAALADSTMQIHAASPYRIGMRDSDFSWGSNSLAANRGMSLLMGYLAAQKDEYRAAALDLLDYLLGRNPTGYSYVTGFGDRTPLFIHHRPSVADDIEAPVPGFLAGGPNPRLQDTADCGGDFYPSHLPAVAYLDNICSYASNEIAINWNAPLVFLAGGIEALHGVDNPNGVFPVRKKTAAIAADIILKDNGRRLEIRSPFSGRTVITVATLQGRVLARHRGIGMLKVAVSWPAQVVVLSIAPETQRTGYEMRRVIAPALSGVR